MPTCPNCGSIIMNGDPYCSHCGTTIRWGRDEDDEAKMPLPEVLQDLELAKNSYDDGNYELALVFLSSARSYYKLLNDAEMTRVGENPFNQDWVAITCCNVFNQHGKSMDAALNFIRENGILVNICDDCSLIFPYDFTECRKCGKPFEGIKQDHDVVRSQIQDILKGLFLDKLQVLMLTDKSISLIESNGCALTEIRQDLDSVIFTFKKEHRYFYTEYDCIFLPGYFRTDRVFYDCIIRNNYDRLLKNDQFKSLIKATEERTGFTFLNCGGGYNDVDFDNVTEDFTFNNRFNVFVRFDTDDGRMAVYDIDLDAMKLSDDYRVYD